MNRQNALCVALVCGAVLLGCSIAEAGGCCGGGSTSGSGIYYVAGVKDSSGAKSIELLESKEYKLREKTLKEDYVSSLKEWKKDKSLPKPCKPAIVQIKKFKGTEKEAAEALTAKLKAKLEAKAEAALDKEITKSDDEDVSSGK